jgi:hypothetical protein
MEVIKIEWMFNGIKDGECAKFAIFHQDIGRLGGRLSTNRIQ